MAVFNEEALVHYATSFYLQGSASSVLERFNALASDAQRHTVLRYAFLACRGVRTNVETVPAEVGIGNLPAAFLVGGKPNMTDLAILGHLMFAYCVPAENERAAAFFASYRASIGGRESVWSIDAPIYIPGKEKRAIVLERVRRSGMPADVGTLVEDASNALPSVFVVPQVESAAAALPVPGSSTAPGKATDETM
jgi:hypothetical protein